MMGYIQGQAPKTAGDWDVAAVPGGGGNWGGSFLAVPKQSKNPAARGRAGQVPDLARVAGATSSSRRATCRAAALYSTRRSRLQEPVLQQRPGRARSSPTSAKKLKPQITGPKQGDIQTAVENAIQRVEQKKQSPDESWAQFLKDVENVAT